MSGTELSECGKLNRLLSQSFEHRVLTMLGLFIVACLFKVLDVLVLAWTSCWARRS